MHAKIKPNSGVVRRPNSEDPFHQTTGHFTVPMCCASLLVNTMNRLLVFKVQYVNTSLGINIIGVWKQHPNCSTHSITCGRFHGIAVLEIPCYHVLV
jgi:hypothetical protein